MSENTEPLRKMTRAQLLEMLVEQSKAVGEIRERMEQLEKQLQEKDEAIEQLKKELQEKDEKNAATLHVLQTRLKKSTAQNKVLKEAAEMERKIHTRPLTEAKTVTEASRYMDQLLTSTRKTMAQYHKLIEQLAMEAKKHE
ncbi:MAG: hypothetical protein E7185_06235 [Erysipelotrichaceae bacterium]|nr:hypothetical protein [Erysipelotrichaceae bacterium]